MTSTNSSSSSSSTPVAIEAVPGLSVCTEFFSTAVETSLYFDPLLFEHSPAEMERQIQERKEQGEKKQLRFMTPMHAFQTSHLLPKHLIQVCNGITESGLCPEFIAPDYCLPITYPAPNGQFFYHYDSRYRWGETVVGITLGTGGIMSFQPQTKKAKGNNNGTPPFVGKRALNNQGLVVEIRETTGKHKSFTVDVHLPPRSVYVMTGDSRTEWKHMVQVNNEKNRNAVKSSQTNPAFWDCIMRRTITLRCTKVFSDEILARLLRANQSSCDVEAKNIQARVKAQSKWQARGDYDDGEMSDVELLESRQRAVRNCNAVHQTFHDVFLSDRERGYVRRFPGKSCWPLKGLLGGNLPSCLVDDLMKKMGLSVSSSSSTLPLAAQQKQRLSSSSTLPLAAQQQQQLSLSEVRAKRCAFFDGMNGGGTAAGASTTTTTTTTTASSSFADLVGSNQKKRKQPPAPAAHSAATAIDLLGDDSDAEEDSKPAASKQKTPPKQQQQQGQREIIEID